MRVGIVDGQEPRLRSCFAPEFRRRLGIGFDRFRTLKVGSLDRVEIERERAFRIHVEFADQAGVVAARL